MKSTLGSYLTQIRQGRPVNYEVFLRFLPRAVAARHRELFQVERVSAQRWQVACLDPGLFEQLEADAVVPDTRQAAALQGDSHRQKTSSAFVLTYHDALPDRRPDVVCLTPTSTLTGFDTKSTVLVVENEDNFAQFEEMLEFAAECVGQPLTITNCDVILGGGNRVGRDLVCEWLTDYEQVLCAFDYDLGGLKMFASLKRRLGAKATFVQPDDWLPWRESFRLTPRTPARLAEAVSRANQLGFDGLAQAFRDTHRFMEQEALLAG